MATAKRKAPAKKAPAKKAAPKTAAKKSTDFSVKESAEKAVNIYLGVIGKSIDVLQENIESLIEKLRTDGDVQIHLW